MLLAAKVPLPVGHPSMERYVCYNSSGDVLQGSCAVSMSNTHPLVDSAISGSAPFPSNHLKVQVYLAPYMPSSHR